ncbi:PepSY domain-containing protein [Neptuniibacter sp. CAU 1671]|uniref:PepSY domain-containing protein n=1 Tax=Neptuniibacter sp. CAU 1671 TaxID=3032593 RepID=UPI0023DB97C8|nr:PepSY domain-containing protein [Neptuniibacter sp. CAU 1671]MDF2181057.1 PepSY domain-containing protein [Neptuniibacter sp. CAU 1671]
MKSLMIATVMMTAAGTALAGPKCTDGDKTNWIPEDTMQQQILDQGYSIKKFKVTSGGCYEIYGYDQEQRRVEIYFHPETGEVVKAKMED